MSRISEPSFDMAAANLNKLQDDDRSFHDWYRFVLSFPPHLVQYYVDKFEAGATSLVLDPFCGTGTTLVQAKKLGIASIGIEANPIGWLASSAKTDWSVDPDELSEHAARIASRASAILKQEGVEDFPFFTHAATPTTLRTLPPEQYWLLLKNSISPLPLHKALVLREVIDEHHDPRFLRYEQVALAKTLVYHSSNLKFGPEVGIGRRKDDAPVVDPWLREIRRMADDLRAVRGRPHADSSVLLGDARTKLSRVDDATIDFVITSPPYPNEKDYSRTTRLELVLLGFIKSKQDLRALKKGLIRSNTRGIYADDRDDEWVSEHEEIQRIAEAIESRRVELKKTSGFEKLYPRVTKMYFGGMKKHLSGLRRVLKPGAKLAYVVGDQASYLQVMIRTGQLLAEIGESLGYRVVDIELFRTRLATATGENLREEVVIMEWPPSLLPQRRRGHGVCTQEFLVQ